MIQTTGKVVYGLRGENKGKVKIEVRPLGENEGIHKFLTIDWDITKSPKEAISSFESSYTDAEIDASDALIEANNSFTGLTRSQKERKKLAIRLMSEVQTKLLEDGTTIFRLTPDKWVYSI